MRRYLLALSAFVLLAPCKEPWADPLDLGTEAIQRVMAAGVARATALKVPMGISVVNEAGVLVGFIKMDGTFAHTDRTSFAKAYTSASLRRPTHELGIPERILAELSSTTGGRITSLPGGYPLVLNGRLVGGVGVGGGNGEQDADVAAAARAALNPR